MTTYFIWGMGLLGTSIALDLKKKGYRIVGCERSTKNLAFLSTLGFSEIIAEPQKDQLSETLSRSDGIIIATPIDSVYQIMEYISTIKLKENIWITDMASTKSDLILWLNKKQLDIPFVGSHPMAGSDLNGPQHAQENLFQSATIYIVESERLKTKYPGKNKQIIDDVKIMWEEVGARTYALSHKQHDRWGAYLSHGLHLISCMTSILVQDIPEVFEVPSTPAGGSFRDITRVSGSNPELWEGIIQSNLHEVKEYLKRFVSLSNELINQLEENQISIKDIFLKAQKNREKIIKEYTQL